jgi:cystathionine gamma-synthase
MNSVTKYLSGHSDVLLGSLTVRDPALHARLLEARSLLGAIAGPLECWIALRGIRTFPLRFRAAEKNAKDLLTRLEAHPAIERVRYPGFGAVISFDVAADALGTEKVCESSQLIAHATSLGGVESTWERRRRWPAESLSVPENLIRLSVGCEHVDDLWDDIAQALAAI